MTEASLLQTSCYLGSRGQISSPPRSPQRKRDDRSRMVSFASLICGWRRSPSDLAVTPDCDLLPAARHQRWWRGRRDSAHPCASETAVIVFCVYCKPPIRDEASREQLSRARGCKPRSLFLTYLREFRVRRDPVYGAHTPDYSAFLKFLWHLVGISAEQILWTIQCSCKSRY